MARLPFRSRQAGRGGFSAAAGSVATSMAGFAAVAGFRPVQADGLATRACFRYPLAVFRRMRVAC